MIYIVDPTLRSSVKSKSIEYSVTRKLAYLLIFFTICALLVLLILQLRTSRLNTSFESTIHIDSRLDSVNLKNRQDSIQDTVQR